MAFSKELAIGNIGKLSVTESAGVAALTFTAAESVAGVASFTQSIGVNVKASDLANMLFELIESKSPVGMVVFEKEAQALAVSLLNKV